ncbi:uncharacterized protein TRIADDRAFT_59721 [Trichoplax adhaerens]|uniref:Kinase suppressor of Ras 2 n=1 Tax=Trichoplax adhaerens TaxID=10228 RepID=B3S691_TRIAD|nr:hypothetical protein TRIADDRAFT_59721 [Trichoplax adhaerens]EDV21582.1 hypothetical protein TRIADDRAFT_59721 [Trichoplax adhaerens]|eukprot:XP_002115730.1 hypothetical protein TRIADDRAFT_59721 [Trichoplax adhaerens]
MDDRQPAKLLKERLEDLGDLQILIDTTVTQLIRTRAQCDVTFDFIQQQLRALEGKVIKYISQQLLEIANGIPPNSPSIADKFYQYPKLNQWLEVVGMESSTAKAICGLQLPLSTMLNMQEEDMRQMLNDVQCNEGDSCRFIAAMKNLRLYLEMLRSGEFPSTASFYWNSWTYRYGKAVNSNSKTSNNEPVLVGRNRSVTSPTLSNSRPNTLLTTSGAVTSSHKSVDVVKSSTFSPSPSSYCIANSLDSGASPTTPQVPANYYKDSSPSVSDINAGLLENNHNVDEATVAQDGSNCNTDANSVLQIIVQPSDAENEIQLSNRSNSLGSMRTTDKNIQCRLPLQAAMLSGSCEALLHDSQNCTNDIGSDYSAGSDSLQKLRSRTLSHSAGTQSSSLVGMGHSIKHRFSHLPMFIAQSCDYCGRIVVMGLKCKECKYKCHSKCAKKAPPSCGLPQDYEKFFKQQLLHDNLNLSQDTSKINLKKLNASPSRMTSAPYNSYNSGYNSINSVSTNDSSTNNLTFKDKHYLNSQGADKIKSIPNSAPPTSVNSTFNFSTPTDGSTTGGQLTESISPFSSTPSSPTMNTSTHLYSPPVSSVLPETSQGTVANDKVTSTPIRKNVNSAEDDLEDNRDCENIESERSSGNEDHSQEDLLTVNRKSRYKRRKKLLSMRTSLASEWIIPIEELKIKDVIGIGHFGRVHRGYWHGDVAIKFVNVSRLTEEAIESFKLEVATFRKTRHDNLVLFMGACMKPPQLAIITSLCRGPSLASLIYEQKDRFTFSKIVSFAREICQGMSYLHSRDIIHKDLKSGNIFYEKCRIVITDFGVSSLVDYNPTPQERNLDCWVIVRDYAVYFAPEIIKKMDLNLVSFGLSAFTKASDVFAFGTVLYEMMVGHWPFSELPVESILWMVGSGKQPPQDEIRLPVELKNILNTCWEYDPEKRIAFTNLLKALNKLPERYLRRSPSCPSNSLT